MGSLIAGFILGIITWFVFRNRPGFIGKYSIIIAIICGFVWPITLIALLFYGVYLIVKDFIKKEIFSPVNINDDVDFSSTLISPKSPQKRTEQGAWEKLNAQATLDGGSTDEQKRNVANFMCMHCQKYFLNASRATNENCSNSPNNHHLLTPLK